MGEGRGRAKCETIIGAIEQRRGETGASGIGSAAAVAEAEAVSLDMQSRRAINSTPQRPRKSFPPIPNASCGIFHVGLNCSFVPSYHNQFSPWWAMGELDKNLLSCFHQRSEYVNKANQPLVTLPRAAFDYSVRAWSCGSFVSTVTFIFLT